MQYDVDCGYSLESDDQHNCLYAFLPNVNSCDVGLGLRQTNCRTVWENVQRLESSTMKMIEVEGLII